ncbi:hypothetical protein CEXT_656191 [Caerostris extrusa]|uniref:Uncharacterized protein n=1 Tax=Caerostris extrusa TaxID=172846 RepID=A0AAV4MXD7_CAEEX|nr:hypothetical protein CEXT_656191 [Caerostris extrusa]
MCGIGENNRDTSNTLFTPPLCYLVRDLPAEKGTFCSDCGRNNSFVPATITRRFSVHENDLNPFLIQMTADYTPLSLTLTSLSFSLVWPDPVPSLVDFASENRISS